MAKILRLMDVLRKGNRTESANLSHLFREQNAQGSGDETASSSSSDVEEIQSPFAHNSTRFHPPSNLKSQPVNKWNLKFTGDGTGMSVHNFLERVEELSVARNVSKRELYDSAIDLFDGKALNWYRSYRHRTTTWEELSNLLLAHYQPPDYKIRLFNDILARKQGPSEPIVDFLACMSAMFSRYGGVAADIRLDIVTRNLAPFYIMQLPIVNSLRELEEECLKLETKKYRADTYVSPTQQTSSFVEPEFAYVSSQPSTSIANPRVNEIRTVTSPKPLSCWNCQSEGHIYRDCTAPRKYRCFKCGHPGVSVKNCPKCNISGNARRRN